MKKSGKATPNRKTLNYILADAKRGDRYDVAVLCKTWPDLSAREVAGIITNTLPARVGKKGELVIGKE